MDGISVLCILSILISTFATLLDKLFDIPFIVTGGIVFSCTFIILVRNVPVIWKEIREKKKS